MCRSDWVALPAVVACGHARPRGSDLRVIRPRERCLRGFAGLLPPASTLLEQVPAELGGVRLGSVRRERERMLACVTFAVGEVEIRAELTPLDTSFLTHERQSVRLEEVAQIDIGQQTRVRRVTR